MRELLRSRAVVWTASVLGTLLVGAVALGLGRILPAQPEIALAIAGAILVLGITAAEPAVIPLLAVPLLLVGHRVGAGSVNVSVSDAALLMATVVALVFTTRPLSPVLRNLLWLSALYQFATLFTVVANPFLANTVEWFHAWVSVSGALLVGWTIGRAGHAKAGLSLFLLAASALAVVTIVQGGLQMASGDFGPVYVRWPYDMHKNFVGTLLAFGAITAYVRPQWMGWTNGWARAAFWTLVAGVAATQSRQAIIGLGFAIFVVVLRVERVPAGLAGSATNVSADSAGLLADSGKGAVLVRRSKLILFAVIPAVAVVLTLVRDQVASGNQFNSFFQRIGWFSETIAFWSGSPWVGHGLRFWYRGLLGFQPPNAELEVLAAAGLLGLAAFLTWMIGTLSVLWRMDPTYGTLAVAVVLLRFVQGQFDQFWVGAQVNVPFAVAGICVGAAALSGQERRLTSATVVSRSIKATS